MSTSSAIPRVAVVVVILNSGACLAERLGALRRQGYTDFEAIIADNASTDGSIERLGPRPERCRVLRLPANLGFAAANSRAMAATSAAWIATLNPDAFPAADWLRELMAAAEHNPEACMFGSTQIAASAPDRLDGTGDVHRCVGLARRSNHGAPVDRCPSEGEAFSHCAAARMHHVGSGIAGRDSDFAVYHGTRNLLWTLVKNVPGPMLPIMLPLHLVAQARRLSLSLGSGQAGPMLRGMRDGLRSLGPILAERRRVQSRRRVAASVIAGAMTWSPMPLIERLALRGTARLTRGLG